RSTLTETESSQRQEERARDIKIHGERRKERGSREEKRSTALSLPASVIQECPLLLLP
ncbi:hypothetical protein KUCAC02_001915, partial [Chaenocephalus aceratus]